MEKVVSVIIPVYNSEQYIETCVNSLLVQTHPYLEIILVDDGSNDRSATIVDELKALHPKIIKVCHQTNQGQSAARNVGLSMAEGEYITFVDNDDYVDKDYLKKLINFLGEDDMLVTGYKRVNASGKVLYKRMPSETTWALFMYCSTWGKLYRLSYLKRIQSIFPNYPIGEDIFFTLKGITSTKKVIAKSYAGYNNLQNLNSVSNTIYLKKDNFEILPLLKDVREKVSFELFDVELVLYFYAKTITQYVMNLRNALDLSEYCSSFYLHFDWLKHLYIDYGKKLHTHWQKEERASVNILVNVFILTYKLKTAKLTLLLIKKTLGKTNK